MKKLFSAALVAFSVGQVVSAQAAGVSVAIGQSSESSMVYRLGTQFDFSANWFESATGRLTGYWDAAYTYWDGDVGASNHSLSFAPVFVYEFAGETLQPYVEAGIGVALFENTELEEHGLGSSFQFENRAGFGLRFADQELGLRAMHYSNAGLKQPNDGVEAYSLHYRLSF
ncbi:MAG: acyloxyacyl hydrolase [Pseudomonas sp.]